METPVSDVLNIRDKIQDDCSIETVLKYVCIGNKNKGVDQSEMNMYMKQK